MRIAAALLFLLTLASCATLSEEECRAGDWAAIGFEDGSDGRLPGYLDRHREACSEYGIVPVQTAWERGRQAGLRVYCTPDRAYSIGRRGGEIAPVCTAAERAAMDAPWLRGLRYYEIGQDIEELEDEIDDLRDVLRGLGTTPEDAARRAGILLDIRRLESRISLLRLRQARYG